MTLSKTILVLGAGPFQVPGIRRAKELGYHVIAVDQDEDAPGLELADHGSPVDLTDVDRCLEIAHQHEIDGVTTVAVEAAVEPMAAIAEELGLPGPSPEAARAASNKHLMRSKFDASNVPGAPWQVSQDMETARASAEEIGYPVVVKPPDRSGSRGVRRVADSEGIDEAFQAARTASNEDQALVEGFLEGPEVSVEAFVVDGEPHVLALSEKVRTDPPYLLDETVAFPAELEESIRTEVVEVTAAAIQALGLDQVAIHAELILTAAGPHMVELAARGAGFHVFTEMVPWVTGCDTVGTLLELAIGERPTPRVDHQRGCILHFPRFGTGQIKRIDGVDAARKLDGVRELEIYPGIGDEIQTLTSGADRPGHIVTAGQTRSEAHDVLRQAVSTIEVHVA